MFGLSKEQQQEFNQRHSFLMGQYEMMQAKVGLLEDLFRQQYNQPKSINIVMTDDNGSPAAIVNMISENVLEMTYIIAEGKLQILLASIRGEGKSELRWAGKSQVKTIGNKPRKVPMEGAYREDMYQDFTLTNNFIEITDEVQIEKIWEWRNGKNSFAQLKELREAHIKKLEDARKEAEARLEKELKDPNATADQKESIELVKEAIKKNNLKPVPPTDPDSAPTTGAVRSEREATAEISKELKNRPVNENDLAPGNREMPTEQNAPTHSEPETVEPDPINVKAEE